MYRLTNEDITRLDKVTKLQLYTALTWMSYQADLDQLKTVQL